MLPEVSIFDNVNLRYHHHVRPQSVAADNALQPPELFDAIFVRHDASAELCRRRRPPDQPGLPVCRLVIVRHLSATRPVLLRRLMSSLDHRRLTTLSLVDCPLSASEQHTDDSCLPALRTLVLSGTGIRRIPAFLIPVSGCLETLKVDRNRLGPELHDDEVIGRRCGRSLRVLVVDAQRPRLRRLSRTLIGQLSVLEVLSAADNRLSSEDIADVGSSGLDMLADTAPRLRVLSLRRNRLTRLPTGMATLDRLRVLDVSHNRLIDFRPDAADLRPLVDRLVRLDLYNAAIFRRPEYRTIRRCDVDAVRTHFDLDITLSNAANSLSEGDVDSAITVAVVGETNAGKRRLLEALAASATGNSVSTTTMTSSKHQATGFMTIEFDVVRRPNDDSGDGRCGRCHVTAMAISGDELADEYVRQVRFDLVLLAFDLRNAYYSMENTR